MIKKVFLGLMVILLTTPAIAKETSYQGKVTGMSCAFCVYNVRKNISKLPGVKSESVKVDLKSGTLNVRSTTSVDVKKISALVAKAGFKLVDFKQINEFKSNTYKKVALVSIKLDSVDLSAYNDLLEKLGDIAAKEVGRLVIRAPRNIEMPLLKAMIAARQNVAQVTFIESKLNSIEITIYQKK